MMHISLFRQKTIGTATIGWLIVTDDNGALHFTCHTIEPLVRKTKVKGCTAIPPGDYDVKSQWSNKFQKNMPFLQNVPNFTGVMLHVGNEVKDTEGCILVGQLKDRKKAYIYNSRLTFNLLEAIISGQQVKMHVYDHHTPL